MSAEEKLTDEQAEAMLKQLSKHFHEPVLPIGRYCKALDTWGRCVSERAEHLRKEIFPNLYETDKESKTYAYTAESQAQQAEYKTSKTETLYSKGLYPTERDHQLSDLRQFDTSTESVGLVFTQIRKSSLLHRLLYCGEKLRTLACPEHKGKWSGIEHADNMCPHGCELTGWIYASDDLPSV